ncbi:Hypothetical protein EIN_277260, partial [Entamoeba invadens IP1]
MVFTNFQLLLIKEKSLLFSMGKLQNEKNSLRLYYFFFQKVANHFIF